MVPLHHFVYHFYISRPVGIIYNSNTCGYIACSFLFVSQKTTLCGSLRLYQGALPTGELTRVILLWSRPRVPL